MSNKIVTLEQFKKMFTIDLWKNAFALTVWWKIALRTVWEPWPKWQDGTSFIIWDVAPENTEWNNWDTYLDYKNYKLYFKDNWVWSNWVDFCAWWFTWLVEDSTWNIIWRWENWLLKDPYYPSPITGWIWMMQIWNDFVVS